MAGIRNGFIAKTSRDVLRAFNRAVGLDAADEDGFFFYVYGFLYSQAWRKKWEVTLRKEAARIELPSSLSEFQNISDAGKALADLHLDYENIAPLADIEIVKSDDFDENNEAHYEVEKMKYGGKRGNLDRLSSISIGGWRYEGYLRKSITIGSARGVR